LPRLTHIDLARGVAALAVVLVHYRWLFDPPLWNPLMADRLPLYALLWPFYDYGGVAVQAFWVLSGVVFAVTYCREDVRFSLRDFAIRRFSRLYPLHLATLLLVAAIQALSFAVFGTHQVYENNDAYHFVLQLFFASSWGFQVGDSFNGPIWSVSVEIIAYAMFAAYVLAASRNVPAALAIACAGIVWWLLSANVIVYCFGLFFLGVAASLAVAWLARRLSKRSMLLLGVALVSASVAIAAAVVRSGQIDRLSTVLTIVCLPIAIAGLVCMDFSLPPVPRSLGWIGAITYATYLTHMPILMMMKMTIAALGWQDVVAEPATLAVFCGTVIAVSIPVYRYFEVPAQAWLREKLLSPKPASVPAAPGVSPEDGNPLAADGLPKADDLRHA
jgi:peptidoglycan/LPS O-acetylase OafA/YrhL